LDYGRSTAFPVSLEGITETEAAGIQKFCTTNRYCAHAPGEPRSMRRYTARLPRTTRSKTNDPQCPYPTPRPFYESAVADKVLRKDRPLSRAVARPTFSACKLRYDIASVECEAPRSQPRPAPANLADDVHASRAGATTASRSLGRCRTRCRPPKSPIAHEPVPHRKFVRRPQGPIVISSPQSQVIAWSACNQGRNRN
jgi:hypothetical protein